ncbi:hypothetical protein TCAL_00595 [Tigriopus californicus]|uniref:Protein fantom n=1 Tax=Tigriopus californicus TaxID=6832 RepID=A0A553PAA1_TIGCA|nr:hypothetical protein TCAL_00595 [Tigriopus californicus]|eukprot:TCALIF_00595-PA protein Name:"Similar to RPGRIP1L Protein fantom (Homo sapiens)" AED:0.19 eAED:0.19 QI:34/0.33/0/1/1/1/4/0/1426
MDHDLDEDEMVPVKDLNGISHEFALHVDPNQVFNQQRAVVAKLSRDDLEDRYLRLLEENVVIKKHACKQEDKIKKLATKLIRVLSDKKRLEMASGGVPTRHRDIETEELIEDQQHKIRELERQSTHLREKLMVTRQQLMGSNSGKASVGGSKGKPHPSSTPVVSSGSRMPGQGGGALSPSSITMVGPGPLLNQQAQRLLEEARTENRMLEETIVALKEQVNLYEQETEQVKEQLRIKESSYEEEIQILKGQLLDGQRHTATENIQLIQLHKENNLKTAQVQSLKAQVQGLEESLGKLKVDCEQAQSELKDVSQQLEEEQRKGIKFSEELAENSASKQALAEIEEKVKDLQKENAILRESNSKLLDSAYNLERERQFQATENALKIQVAQLEATLKSDLNDKKALQEALMKEREQYAKIEGEYQELQGKYFAVKENIEGQEEKLAYFAKENSINMKELEDALLILRQKNDSVKSFPSFLNEIESGNKDLKVELSEVQVQYVESIHELDKTRSLLRVQGEINGEQKNEINALQTRLQQVKAEYQSQMLEYKKLLEMRANRIQKLENQLRESAYGNLQKNLSKAGHESGSVLGKDTSVHIASGQSLFEIHIQKVHLTQETLVFLGLTEPKLFATWAFYDHDLQYTPMGMGPEAVFDSSSYYKIKLDDSLLDYISEHCVQMDLHLVVAHDCRHIGQTMVKLGEVLEYPTNKLHGSTILYGVGEANKQRVIGTLDYWFKLHTAATKRIFEWIEHKREIKRMLDNAEQKQTLTEVSLLEVETKALIEKNMTLPDPPRPPKSQETVPKETKQKMVGNAKSLVSKASPKPKPRGMDESQNRIPAPKDTELEPMPKTRSTPKKPLPVTQSKSASPIHEESSSSEESDENNETPVQTTLKPRPKPKLNQPRPKSAKIITLQPKQPEKPLWKSNEETTSSSSSSTSSEEDNTGQDSKKQQSANEALNQPTSALANPTRVVPSPRPTFVSGGGIGESSSEDESSEDEEANRQPSSKPLELILETKNEEGSPSEPSRNKTPQTPDDHSESHEREKPKPKGRPKNKENLSKYDTERKAEEEKSIDSKKETKGKQLKTDLVAEVKQVKGKDEKKKEEKPDKGKEEKPDKGKEEKPDKGKEKKPDKGKEKKEPKKEEQDTGKEPTKDEEEGHHEEVEDQEKEKEKKKSEKEDAKKPTKRSFLQRLGSKFKSLDKRDDKSKSRESVQEEKPEGAEQNDAKKKKEVSHEIGETTDDEENSEGVVMRRHSPLTKRASIPNLDVVIISISEFRVTNKNAKLLKDDQVEKLYVEFKFLDVPDEELETPFSLPKPKKLGDSIVFNFRKVIPLDRGEQSNRRRLFSKMLSNQGASSKLRFTVVSEPSEKAKYCDDIGIAEVDLASILKSKKDLVDCNLEVLGETKKGTEPIGTLTVSILATEVIKSLKL